MDSTNSGNMAGIALVLCMVTEKTKSCLSPRSPCGSKKQMMVNMDSSTWKSSAVVAETYALGD